MKRELNLGALPIARDEYLNQLVSFLQPLISKGFWSIYTDARKKCSREGRQHERFRDFQHFVKKIPKWNSLIVEEETRRIKEKIDCLSELITVIFVGNVKILASIRLKGNNNNIKVKIPSCNNFIHTVYINTAKRVFYNPLLFDHKCNPIDIEKNMDQVYEYIEKSVIETIQQMLPIKNILDEYLGNVFENEVTCNDEDNSSDDDKDDFDGESFYGGKIDSESENDEDSGMVKEINNPKNIINFPNKIPNVEKSNISNYDSGSENSFGGEDDDNGDDDSIQEDDDNDSISVGQDDDNGDEDDDGIQEGDDEDDGGIQEDDDNEDNGGCDDMVKKDLVLPNKGDFSMRNSQTNIGQNPNYKFSNLENSGHKFF